VTLLPLPNGYTAAQCKWTVSVRQDPNKNNSDVHELICFVDGTRHVRVYEDVSSGNDNTSWDEQTGTHRGTVNYIVIGIK